MASSGTLPRLFPICMGMVCTAIREDIDTYSVMNIPRVRDIDNERVFLYIYNLWRLLKLKRK